jgi:S-adenosylmethionine decarboxylase proenzyme
LRQLCLRAVQGCGLSAVGELFHRFEQRGGGVTGVVLLAESHLAVHTWPELGAVTLDVYVCNFSGDNSARADSLLADLRPPSSRPRPNTTGCSAVPRTARRLDLPQVARAPDLRRLRP